MKQEPEWQNKDILRSSYAQFCEFSLHSTNYCKRLPRRSQDLINTTLLEIYFKDRKLALTQKQKKHLRFLPFVTQYQPSVPNLKQILMTNWHLIEQQQYYRAKSSRIRPSYLTKEGGHSKTYSWEPNYEHVWKRLLKTRAEEPCRPVNPILHLSAEYHKLLGLYPRELITEIEKVLWKKV